MNDILDKNFDYCAKNVTQKIPLSKGCLTFICNPTIHGQYLIIGTSKGADSIKFQFQELIVYGKNSIIENNSSKIKLKFNVFLLPKNIYFLIKKKKQMPKRILIASL